MKTKPLKVVKWTCAMLLASWFSVFMTVLISPVRITFNEIIPYLVLTPLILTLCIGVVYLVHKLIDG